jgi:hypothetical protein
MGAALAVAVNLFLHGSHSDDPKTRDAAQGEP